MAGVFLAIGGAVAAVVAAPVALGAVGFTAAGIAGLSCTFSFQLSMLTTIKSILFCFVM